MDATLNNDQPSNLQTRLLCLLSGPKKANLNKEQKKQSDSEVIQVEPVDCLGQRTFCPSIVYLKWSGTLTVDLLNSNPGD